MADFKVIRDRDAWAAIRGFVYQVDQTLLDWLGLEPPRILELERGEDIDVVLPTFTDTEQSSRQLTQLKYLDRNLSLRTPHLLTTLASFREHLTNNPALDLKLVFRSNCGSTAERPSPLPSGQYGIDVWIGIASNSLPLTDYSWAIRGLRIIIGNASKPAGLTAKTWQPFIKFVRESTADELLNFVRRVEWKLRGPDNERITTAVQDSIRTRFHLNRDDAANLYLRLFVYVIRLLSQRGFKRLSSEDLAVQIAKPILNREDQALLSRVESLLLELESRVTALESGYLAHEERLNLIQAEVSQIANSYGVAVSVNYGSEVLDLDQPPLVEPVVKRETAVQNYLEILKNVVWSAIHGEVGGGKTQLALLIVTALGRPSVWVRFRGLNPAQACSRIDQALAILSNTRVGTNWQRWCRRACSLIARQTILVFDDLPRVQIGELLFEHLTHVGRALAANQIQLLSTSAFDFPAELKRIDDNALISAAEIPRFFDDEIQELFRLHGAPHDFFRENRLGLVATLTRRHPTLLTAMATYLTGREWRFASEEFDDLITGRYASEANNRTIAALLNTLPDPNARDLIYRLNLVGGPFTEKEVRIVSSIPPKVQHPFEKMADFIGLWVQRDSKDSYVLSPLVQQLGSQNLDPDTLRGVHLGLAKDILSKGKIDERDLSSTILHYISAGEYNDAARTLLWALASMSTQRVSSDPWGISAYWYGMPLPGNIDLNLRIHLRAMQAQIGEQLQKSTRYVLNDLDHLLEIAGQPEASAITHATIVAGPLLMEAGLERANRYLLKFLSLVPGDVRPDGTKLEFPAEMSGPGLIWATVRMVDSADDVKDWFNTLSQFTDFQIKEAMRAPVAAEGAMAIADRLWLWEARKDSSARDWKRVLNSLKEFTAIASRLQAEILWACLVRSQIIVLAEYELDVDGAVALGEEALSIVSCDPEVQSLLKMSIGIQLSYAGRQDEGTEVLRSALDEPAKFYPLLRVDSLLKLGSMVGSEKAEEALLLIDRSIDLARQSSQVPESELIKALGEKAVAQWLNDDLNASYEPLAEGAQRLLDRGQEDNEAKALFTLFTHVSGFLMHLAVTGDAIREIADGSPYAAPERGFFLKRYPDVVSYYRKEFVCFLPTQIAYFARVLKREDELAEWSLRAMSEARKSGDDSALIQISPLVLDAELIKFRIPEAVDAAVHFGMGLTAFEIDEKAGRNPLRKDFNILEILGPKPGASWITAYSRASAAALLPIFLQLANLRLETNRDVTELLADVQSACEQVAATAPQPELWRDGARLLREIFDGTVGSAELMQRAPEFSADMLQGLAFLGAALDTFPEQAVHNHLETMPTIIDLLVGLRSTFARIVIRFYKSFWSKTFQNDRFRFRTPGVVEQELNHLLVSEEWTVVPDILRLMSSSLGITPSQRVQMWMEEKMRSNGE